MPVLHHGVAHISQLRLAPRGLAIEPAFRVARALMGVVLASLAMEVRTIAIAPILGTEAPLGGPGFDQGAVHRKMLVRQQRLHLRVVQKLRHELLEHLALLQTLAVLGEGRRIPHRIIRGEPHKPAIEQVIIQLLHQLPLRPDAIENLDQQRAQQLFRRYRGPALLRIKTGKAPAQILQDVSDKLPDLPQWMVRGNPRLRGYVGKQPALVLKCPAHLHPPPVRDKTESRHIAFGQEFFSKLLGEAANAHSIGACPSSGGELRSGGRADGAGDA